MEAKPVFQSILDEVLAIKQDCLNRNDPEFVAWHLRLADAIREFASFKIPAFEEIRFASDFFLSKDSQDAPEINDRIALACDVDEAVSLVQAVLHHLEKQTPALRQSRKTAVATPTSNALDPNNELMRLVDVSGLSEKEKAEFNEEMDGLQRELNRETPDWDLIKRKMKYLIDFGREPALKILPQVLRRLNGRY